MTLESIRAKAQKDANASGRELVIYNLNPYSPLYVIREYPSAAPSREAITHVRGFVEFVQPTEGA